MSDFTYVPTDEGWLYVAVILDLWSRRVVGWNTSTTMVAALSGSNLPLPAANGPRTYEFSGVYDGQVRTIIRVPAAADSTTPDSGPCKGEQPRGAGSFYCAPLLVSATARLVDTPR